MEMIIGRSLTPLNSSRTIGSVRRRDDNSRGKVQNVRGDSRAVLMDGANINAIDAEGRTALFRVTLAGDIQFVRLLVSKGANVNIPDKRGWTPLMLAVRSGDVDVVRLLLVNKADASVRTSAGQTALDIAQSRSSFEIADLIKGAGRYVFTGGAGRRNADTGRFDR